MGLANSLISSLARLFGVSLVELAADREGAGRQLAEAAATAADDETLLDVTFDSVGHDLIAARFGDDPETAAETVVEELGGEPDEVFWKPVETIETLNDSPAETYIWVLRDGVNPAGFADQIDSMYREHYGRAPRGLHVPVADVEEIRLADPDELRAWVEPHLSRSEEAGSTSAADVAEDSDFESQPHETTVQSGGD